MRTRTTINSHHFALCCARFHDVGVTVSGGAGSVVTTLFFISHFQGVFRPCVFRIPRSALLPESHGFIEPGTQLVQGRQVPRFTRCGVAVASHPLVFRVEIQWIFPPSAEAEEAEGVSPRSQFDFLQLSSFCQEGGEVDNKTYK